MVHKFIAVKGAEAFEVNVDGIVKIIPVHNDLLSKESLELKAQVHQTIVNWECFKERSQNFDKTTVNYFENNGFKIENPE